MLIIERFEDDKAVIEDGDSHFSIDRDRLPHNAKEGDVIALKDGIYVVDRDTTNERRRRITELQNSLWS